MSLAEAKAQCDQRNARLPTRDEALGLAARRVPAVIWTSAFQTDAPPVGMESPPPPRPVGVDLATAIADTRSPDDRLQVACTALPAVR